VLVPGAGARRPARGLTWPLMSTSAKEHRMTTPELAKRVAADAGIPAGQAASVVDAAFDAIAGELAAGRDIAIAGFGQVQRHRPRGPSGTQSRDR
jgi:hypothetical protein